MASSLQARVQDLVGTVSDAVALKEFLDTGARVLIDMMPEEVLRENSKEITVPSSGLTIGDFRIHSANKNGYGCTEVSSSMRALVQDVLSIYYALPTDPVMLFYNDKIYIYPGGGTVLAVRYPSVSVTASSIDYIQTKLEQIPVYYAAIQIVLGRFETKLSDLDTLDDNVPEAPASIADPSFSYDTITAPSVSIGASIPTFTKPTFLGDFDTLTTPLDTEEDSELSETHLARINTYLNQYKLDLESEVSEFNKELSIYQAGLQQAVKYADMVMDAAKSNQRTDLEEQIAEYQALISKHQAEVAVYGTAVNLFSTRLRSKLEGITGITGQLEQLRAEYKILLQVHLGVR